MEHSNLAHNEPLGTSEFTSQKTHGKPAWELRALLILLVLTAIAYIWELNQSGWSNSFYSAAVQAGTKSWKAFFFGSIDASNFITVDKPPASLWVMELSARLFGLNSWSLLVPEALEGVACVWILYITVRRWFSPGAALFAGVVLALTPIAAVMFRFNNPDALLVLLLTASAYAFTRALEEGKTKWLVFSSVLIGLGFLTKMMAAFFVIPAFVFVYLIFAPVSIRRRIVQIIISALTVVVSGGWWVAIVQLVPAADRPYIASTQTNSILDLIFGYNGLGRLTGNENGPGGGGGGHFSGTAGITRLFNSEMGGQISWLIPAALVLCVAAIWLLRRNWKSVRAFPALILWAATFLITGIVFSFGSGTIHSYYTVALAPSIGAMIGISVDVLWKRRDEWAPRISLAAAAAVTAVLSFALLERSSSWLPWLRVAILLVGGVAALALAFGPGLGRNLFKGAAIASIAASLAGPLAYTLQSINTPHTGSTPSAGPAVSGGFGNFGGGQGMPGLRSTNTASGQSGMPSFGSSGQSGLSRFRGNGNFGGFGGGAEASANTSLVNLLKSTASQYTWAAATVGSQVSATYQLASGLPIMDIGGFTGSDPTPTLAQFKKYVSEGKIHYFISGGMGARGGFSRMGFINGNSAEGGGNGSSASWNKSTNGTRPSWRRNSNGYAPSWGGNTSTNGEASSGTFIRSGMGGGFGSNSAITTWVQTNFKSKTVGGVTVYDLTQSK